MLNMVELSKRISVNADDVSAVITKYRAVFAVMRSGPETTYEVNVRENELPRDAKARIIAALKAASRTA